MALLAPMLLVGGFVLTTGISVFENLPSYMKPVNASQSSTLFATDDAGKPVKVATFYHENRISVDYEDISPYFVDAVVSTEDPRFWQHAGVDIISFTRASFTNVASAGQGPGGSTITMQYVKNSLIAAATIAGDEDAIADAQARSIDRKLREMRLAIALEQQSNKKEIRRLFESVILRRSATRRRGSGKLLLRHYRQRPENSSGGHACRNAQGSERLPS
jgi:membrane peptidoglycan carboxypeptidase